MKRMTSSIAAMRGIFILSRATTTGSSTKERSTAIVKGISTGAVILGTPPAITKAMNPRMKKLAFPKSKSSERRDMASPAIISRTRVRRIGARVKPERASVAVPIHARARPFPADPTKIGNFVDTNHFLP
jgi:hypothetical protein